MGKYPEIEEKMEKRINGYAGELKTIRAGRANASVLDKVAIDYYGTMTPVQQVGSISSPEPRLLVIQPWDARRRNHRVRFERNRKGYTRLDR